MSLASIICYSRAISRSLLSTSTINRSLAVLFSQFQRHLSHGARAVRGGAGWILWVEQPWNIHPRKLDREIFEDGPSAKIGSLENFRPYGIHVYITMVHPRSMNCQEEYYNNWAWYEFGMYIRVWHCATVQSRHPLDYCIPTSHSMSQPCA